MANPSSSDLRTKLAKARGLGSAKHGVGHWWIERVSALALIPLCLWFVYSLVTMLLSPNVIHVAEWFASPINAIVMVLLLGTMFVHTKLGLQVVIEDYVKSPVAKYTLILANTFICYLFVAVCIMAVLKLHFLDVTAATM